ncbi:hypothetical protein QTP88_011706 [Uroleucon formosanum]
MCWDLMPAANMLQLDSVINSCVKFLQDKLNPSNCLDIIKFADFYDAWELLRSSEECIRKYFREVAILLCLKEKILFCGGEIIKEISRRRSSDLLLGRNMGEHQDVSSKIWIDKSVSTVRMASSVGLSTGAVNPTGKEKRLIVYHIGSEDGFVHGELLYFESKKYTQDLSPSGYTFLREQNILPLPCINTIKNHLLAVEIRCGFNKNLFELLTKRFSTKNNFEKKGILLFDEIS